MTSYHDTIRKDNRKKKKKKEKKKKKRKKKKNSSSVSLDSSYCPFSAFVFFTRFYDTVHDPVKNTKM